MSNESALVESIGRAVLAAIQNVSTTTTTASGPPHATTPVPTTYNYTPGPATPTTSTGTSYRSGSSTSVTTPLPATDFAPVTCLSNDYQGRHQISKEELEHVLSLKTTFTEAASILSISRPTFYKLLQDHNIPTSKFKSISDQQLDLKMSQIKTEHPNVGEVMLMGHLRSKNIVVQRQRLLDSLADHCTSELIMEERTFRFGRTSMRAVGKALY
nr:mucin-5AC-like [Misgurnus anguillicaudatus]